MRWALELARRAMAAGDTPVGSLVVRGGAIVGEGIESVRALRDIAGHAELIALREACRTLGTFDLSACVLYTTAEPCWMC
ncbi:MAG: nucleoside deaminase, partial [Pseudomonadota bacterium]